MQIYTQVEAKELLVCVEAARPESGSRCTKLKKQLEFYATTREFIIPMSIMLFLSVIQGACGCDTISYYSLTIFRKAKISIDEYLMSILLQVIKISFIHNDSQIVMTSRWDLPIPDAM